MAASITRGETGYIVKFERHLEHPVERVWAILTENDQLQRWFPELSVKDLRKNGVIKFDMQDGTFEEMKILDFKAPSILEYTWGNDIVRFELHQQQGSCVLILLEKLSEITSHTPRDVAGWHVCLDVIESLLDGKNFGPRQEIWKKRYEEYVQKIGRIQPDQ